MKMAGREHSLPAIVRGDVSKLLQQVGTVAQIAVGVQHMVLEDVAGLDGFHQAAPPNSVASVAT